MNYDPNGMITRRHFMGYKAGCGNNPPPLHVVSVHHWANHWPLPRPMETRAETGPAVVLGGPGYDSLGIDPTDPASWEGRGYRQSAGMMGRFNLATDWLGIPHPGGEGVRPI